MACQCTGVCRHMWLIGIVVRGCEAVPACVVPVVLSLSPVPEVEERFGNVAIEYRMRQILASELPFPPPEIGRKLNVGFVHSEHRLTPVQVVEGYVAQWVRVEHRPKALEFRPVLQQNPSEYRVSAAVG